VLGQQPVGIWLLLKLGPLHQETVAILRVAFSNVNDKVVYNRPTCLFQQFTLT